MYRLLLLSLAVPWLLSWDVSNNSCCSAAFAPTPTIRQQGYTIPYGWLDPFGGKSPHAANAKQKKSSSSSSSKSDYYKYESTYSSSREQDFPEQYPATYERNTYRAPLEMFGDAALVRPLLKSTQLEKRPLRVAYDANWQGWNALAFHRAVDGQGAAVVLAKCRGQYLGGYNPKGWSSTGGARPSVAAFLFYAKSERGTGSTTFQKLRKIGGGGLACARDDPDTGIWLGADGLVIPLEGGRGRQPRAVQSRLGTYFERGPEGRYSILPDNGFQLEELKVLVGVYRPGEEIPYSGAVLDFTSG